MKEVRRTAIDLFAGAGGLSIGLHQAGFDILFANEISEIYSGTLKHNHPHTEVVTDDICGLNPSRIRKQLSLKKGELDLLAGGPPCQGFSINAPIRSTEDHRNHLFQEYLRFVEEFQPKVVLIENVPGMVSFDSGGTIRAILSALENLGYSVEVRVLYAAHFGVPQMRWRTVFLATSKQIDPISLFPAPLTSAASRANFTSKLDGISLIASRAFLSSLELKEHVTVADAISDLPTIPSGGGEQKSKHITSPQTPFQKMLRGQKKTLWNHRCAGLGMANLARLKHIPQGGSWRDIPFELLPAGMKRARRSDHTKRYGRLAPDGLASTILTKCDPHWGSYFHPTQDRVISVREAARLQSFPDHIVFLGSLVDQYKQVGNAVPPVLAHALGSQIRYVLEMHDKGQQADSSTHFPKSQQMEMKGVT